MHTVYNVPMLLIDYYTLLDTNLLHSFNLDLPPKQGVQGSRRPRRHRHEHSCSSVISEINYQSKYNKRMIMMWLEDDLVHFKMCMYVPAFSALSVDVHHKSCRKSILFVGYDSKNP